MTRTVADKQVNLTAVQNLHGYLEVIRSRLVSSSSSSSRDSSKNGSILELDFILTLENSRTKKKKNDSNVSRRRVELVYPHDSIRAVAKLYAHSRREILKLLKVAGLEIPKEATVFDDDYHQEEDNDVLNDTQKSAYEISRDKFVRNIQWQNYDKMYQKAVADMEADRITEGLVRKYPGRRRALIANILSRTRMVTELDFMVQLVTFRRLSLLFEEHFFELELEDHGKLWETHCRILLCGPRRNNSGSAVNRRKEGGFLFTVHPNMTLTIQMPVDFRDEEFVRELDGNIWHFYEMFEEDGMEDLFPSAISTA